MLSKLNIAMYQVSDMDRAVAFYRDVCGLRAVTVSPGWSQFDLGNDLQLGLHPAREGLPEGEKLGQHGRGWVLGFEVAHIVGGRRRLMEAGATIHGDYHDTPPGVILSFEDPDGNPLDMTQLGLTVEKLRERETAAR